MKWSFEVSGDTCSDDGVSDWESVNRMLTADRLHAAVFAYDQKLRSIVKYDESRPEAAHDAFEESRRLLWESLEEHEITVDI